MAVGVAGRGLDTDDLGRAVACQRVQLVLTTQANQDKCP